MLERILKITGECCTIECYRSPWWDDDATGFLIEIKEPQYDKSVFTTRICDPEELDDLIELLVQAKAEHFKPNKKATKKKKK